MGGKEKNPTYRGMKDYTESIQLDYDANVVSYEALLKAFWSSHSPYSRRSRQYRSVIFYHNESQKAAAEKSLKEHEAVRGGKVFTAIEPSTDFYMGEGYHQKYKLQSHYFKGIREGLPAKSIEELIHSPAAAKINGYVDGYGSKLDALSEVGSFGLTEGAKKILIEVITSRRGGGGGSCGI
jgi:methionine-S-sulfoxide reductase